jgi:hypothetical protein
VPSLFVPSKTFDPRFPEIASNGNYAKQWSLTIATLIFCQITTSKECPG